MGNYTCVAIWVYKSVYGCAWVYMNVLGYIEVSLGVQMCIHECTSIRYINVWVYIGVHIDNRGCKAPGIGVFEILTSLHAHATVRLHSYMPLLNIFMKCGTLEFT